MPFARSGERTALKDGSWLNLVTIIGRIGRWEGIPYSQLILSFVLVLVQCRKEKKSISFRS